MSFANEDDMQNAITSAEQYEIKGNRLYWVDAEAKVCHKCASPDHLIKNCRNWKVKRIQKQTCAI